jgi:hypothetical protein
MVTCVPVEFLVVIVNERLFRHFQLYCDQMCISELKFMEH